MSELSEGVVADGLCEHDESLSLSDWATVEEGSHQSDPLHRRGDSLYIVAGSSSGSSSS